MSSELHGVPSEIGSHGRRSSNVVRVIAFVGLALLGTAWMVAIGRNVYRNVVIEDGY